MTRQSLFRVTLFFFLLGPQIDGTKAKSCQLTCCIYIHCHFLSSTCKTPHGTYQETPLQSFYYNNNNVLVRNPGKITTRQLLSSDETKIPRYYLLFKTNMNNNWKVRHVISTFQVSSFADIQMMIQL